MHGVTTRYGLIETIQGHVAQGLCIFMYTFLRKSKYKKRKVYIEKKFEKPTVHHTQNFLIPWYTRDR